LHRPKPPQPKAAPTSKPAHLLKDHGYRIKPEQHWSDSKQSINLVAGGFVICQGDGRWLSVKEGRTFTALEKDLAPLLEHVDLSEVAAPYVQSNAVPEWLRPDVRSAINHLRAVVTELKPQQKHLTDLDWAFINAYVDAIPGKGGA
jgi:hypothetical protein